MLKKLINNFNRAVGKLEFDKYRKKGAYHWEHYESLIWYKIKVDYIISKISEINSNGFDIGCGDGLLVSKLSEKLDKVIGIDICKDGINCAIHKINEHNITNAFFYCCDLKYYNKNLNFEKFKYITCLDVIEHIKNDVEFIEDLGSSNFFTEDARIFIGTPIFLNNSLVSKYHYREYTLPEIRNLLSTKFIILEEKLFDDKRKDGRIYDNNYYIAECIVKKIEKS